MDEQPIEIRFEHNKALILPKKTQLLYSTYFYAIYGTNQPQFFIKVYKNEDDMLNGKLSTQFVKTTNSLARASHLNLRVHNVASFPPLRAVLVDNYLADFGELLAKRFFTTHFDCLKLLYQLAGRLEELRLEGLEGFFVGPPSVVADHHMNFRLTNLDLQLNDSTIRMLTERQEFYVYQFAPEFLDGQRYTPASNVWDLGVLFYAALSGGFANVDYEARTVFLNDELLAEHPVLAPLVRAMLSFAPAERPALSEILAAVTRVVSESLEPCAFFAQPTAQNEFGRPLLDFANQMNHRFFDNFEGAANPGATKRSSGNIADGVAMITSNDLFLQDDVLQKLVVEAYNLPERHVKFYYEVKEGLEHTLTSVVATAKLLLALHSYVFRSSRHALVVFMKDGRTNALDFLLRAVVRHFQKVNETLVLNYAILLLRKFNLHFAHIKLMENNCAFSKLWLFEAWADLAAPRFLTDLLNHACYLFAFLTAFKRFKFNYFTRNVAMFALKEYVNLFSAIVNLLGLVLYLDFHAKAPEEEAARVRGFVDAAAEVLQGQVGALNTAIEEMNKNSVVGFDRFLLRVNLHKKLRQLRRRIFLRSREFSIVDFSKQFFSCIIRMPESYDMNSGTLDRRLEEKARDLPRARRVYAELVVGLGAYAPVRQYLFGRTAALQSTRSVRFLEPEQSGEFAEELAEVNDLTVIDIKESVKEAPQGRGMHAPEVPVQKSEAGVQVDLLAEVKQLAADKEELLRPEAVPLPPPPAQPPAEVPREAEPPGLQRDKSVGQLRESRVISQIEEDFNSHEGLEKFLLRAFARSVEEWIIDFPEIKFESLIATGSTCNVYRGTYRNLTVAIKKLIKPEADNKIKFLKEFKRELSLLVSLPNHSSLLTLVGFCIKDHEVYLVSEFCDGGTLFDLLYKKSVPIKLN